MSNTESKNFWVRAALGSAVAVPVISGLRVALADTGFGNLGEFVLGLTFAVLLALVVTPLLFLLWKGASALPRLALLIFSASAVTLCLLLKHSSGQQLRFAFDHESWSWLDLGGVLSLGPIGSIALAVGLISAMVWVYRQFGLQAIIRGEWRCFGALTGLFVVLALVIVSGLAGDGYDPYPSDGALLERSTAAYELENAAGPGTFAVESLAYGAGPNPRRPEFAAARGLESRTVDASRLLPEWKGFKQQQREAYWGFGLDAAPLNGMVWAPEGEGPFPLVLIVHGNHGMEDFSDAGYAYLGESLASQGFIVVSVDQNYINGSWSGDFQGKEMAARGWLLLEHLALWRDWNEREGHPFASRVDMRNIALIGHSRGGEAVSIAHRFNSLPYFPDNARVAFNYDFSIQSLVAIAQVDQRYHRRVRLEDVNFLTLHGSYDSDEPAYHGLRQMNRIQLTGQDYFVKAGVYLHRANHGQFNSGWGRYDYSPPGSWLLNTAPMITGEDQRQVASVYISAFLRATLQGQDEYLAFLKDPRVGADWLPRATYVNQFVDSTFVALADFDEDLDASTASRPGDSIRTEGLALWREEALIHRDNRAQGSNALVVGWREPGTNIAITLGDSAGVTVNHSLVFAVSGSLEQLPSDDTPGDKPTETRPTDPSVAPTIADFSIELVDGRGTVIRALASDFAQLVPPVRVQYLKDAAANRKAYNRVWEPVLQTVELPIARLLSMEPTFKLSQLQEIRFVFDQADDGVLILDEIGIAKTQVY